MRHLLVTNDFPPKVGGIQSYLWELWRRLPADEVTVLTTPHPDAATWDAEQAFRVERSSERVLLPTPSLVRRIDGLAAEVDAGLVLLDPALPVGLARPPAGAALRGRPARRRGHHPRPPARQPAAARPACCVTPGWWWRPAGYPAAEGERAAGRALPTVVVPPGVDVERFHPLAPDERADARRRLGLDPDAMVVLGLSRLVPRKGFDVVIEAVARLAATRPALRLVIAGAGRDQSRLERVARRHGAPARFLGRVPDDELAQLHGCVDVFAMVCRNRWFGLEQEGFGIVFLEAAAAGVPQLAGDSGGSHEAVVDGVTGSVVSRPRSVEVVAAALAALVDHPQRRRRMAEAGRRRAVEEFTYDALAGRLAEAIAAV